MITQRYKRNGLPDDRMGRLRYRVVVADPQTPNATVVRVDRLANFQELTQGNGQPLRGIEPTLTFDGHLLVWQGHPSNDGRIDTLVYSINQQNGAAGGWTQPRTIADMYPRDRSTTVAGVRFDDRFPLAQQPLYAANGARYQPGQVVHGAYPWISRDGSELFFTSTVAGQAGVNRARRGGQAAIGRLTGWVLRHLDGPLNPDREATVRLFTSSPGLTPGFWTPFRDAERKIPAGAGQPIYPIFGSNTSNYADVDMSDAADGEYTLALRFNEAVDAAGRIVPSQTPDSSGRPRAGRLVDGAAFPQELGMPDRNAGYVGQAVFFPQRGSVRVAQPTFARGQLTVSMWVKRLASLAGDAANRYVFLAHQPGAWNLILEEDGAIHATVNVNGQARRSLQVGPRLQVDRWTHVAMTYRASNGRLRVFLDGELRKEDLFGAGQLDASSAELIVGPGGQRPLAPQLAANAPLLALDELLISRVERSPREVADAAYRPRPVTPPSRNPGAPLPLGIPASALRVPASATVSDAAATLGETLFFDPRLSADGSVSCATCHQPSLAFTDGRPKALGVDNRVGQRNTPTIVNRALSSVQFYDGRAVSLEDQALRPIAEPSEMNLPVDQALARLRTSPTYTQRFQAAFGRGPDRATLAAALGAFQRRQLLGDSRVDRYEAGTAGALTPQELRGRELFAGKARCTACHSGPNFTDEAFHATNLAVDVSDLGRQQATGRASDRGEFKTPTLRALPRTAPYFHDGSVATLEEVVDLYNRGGLRRDGLDVEMRPLSLTAAEQAALVAFLRALDGPSTDRPAPTLPGDLTFTPPREAWVQRMYRTLLERNPAPSQVAIRVQALARGVPPLGMAQGVARSNEALTLRVRTLYSRYLNRQPDPSGQAAHLRNAQSGTPLLVQEEGFILSAEFAAKHPGTRGFVTGLYQTILQRQPDMGGLNHYTALLTASPDRKREIVRSILRSTERLTKFTTRIFTAAVGRAPTATERSRWVAELQGGLALEDLGPRVLGETAP